MKRLFKSKLFNATFALSLFVALLMPMFVAHGAAQELKTLIKDILDILNLVIPVIFALAVIFFLWALAKYISKSGDAGTQAEARGTMIWGIVIIFVMASVWGLVNLLINSLPLGDKSQPPVPQVKQEGGAGIDVGITLPF